MDVVTSWEEIPAFATESAEAQYWLLHRLDAKLMETAVTDADHSESVMVTLRMDPRMLSRIKRLARSRYLNYQSMIKQWIAERMEEEQRDRGGR